MTRGLAAGLVAVVCLTGLAVGAIAPAAAQAGDYDVFVDADDLAAFPDRTVTIGDATFTENSIAVVERGNSIDVRVTPPTSADEQFSVNLYNEEFQIVESTTAEPPSGIGTVEASFSNPGSGSYMVAVLDGEGDFRAIQSIVVPSYDVTLTQVVEPETEGTVFEVSVESAGDRGLPPTVQVVLADEDTTEFVNAERVEEGTYRAQVSEAVDPGTYTVAGAVRGTEELKDGRAVVLGVSRTESARVESVGVVVGDADAPAKDPDGDGLVEDIDGDDDFNVFDVQVFLDNFRSDDVRANADRFDYDGDGEVTVFDVQEVLDELVEEDSSAGAPASVRPG